MNFNIYLFIVFIIQLCIAILNYYIAYRHHKLLMPTAEAIDILCGISWTMTGLYKLFEVFHLI